MKTKTKIGAGLAVILIAIMTVFMAVHSFADNSMWMQNVAERENGDVYKNANIGSGKIIWKYVSYENGTSTTKNYDNAIYCINPEVGFGTEDALDIGRQEYDVSFDMKDLSNVDQEYKDMLQTMYGSTTWNDRYNAMLWIIDNMYLPKQTPEADRIVMKRLLLNTAGINRDVLTDNDIEVVQQLALWYFSSENAKYHYEPDNFPSLTWNDIVMEIGIFNDDYHEGLDPDSRRYNDMETLYTYLVTSAASKASLYGYNDVRNIKVPSLSFIEPADNTKTETAIIDGVEYFIAGPYKIKDANNSTLSYTIDTKVLDQSNNSVANYKLFDASNNEIETIDRTFIEKNTDDEGKEFYIGIPTTNTTISKIKLNIKANYVSTSATLWTHSTSYNTYQPVVIPEKELKEIEIEKEVTVKRPEFDLSLRKFITQINGVDVAVSRDPNNSANNIDVTGLQNETKTTATYTHPKNALKVNIGDIVTYTLRVYNEGELDGYAQEIRDHLPEEGLEFINNDFNTSRGWTFVEENNEKLIKTAYLSREKDEDNIIHKFNKETGEIDYKDVQIMLKVVATTDSTKPIVNIAEISEDADENGNVVTDRDSTPNNVVTNNYNPPADNSSYQQDDDDYEPLVLSYFDLALRKFITGVNDTEVTTREPQVSNLDKLKAGTVTTATYTHPKEPVTVKTGDKVTYTIRVYNEGETAGYAEEITDNIPEGLKFLPDDNTNKEFKWVMYRELKATEIAAPEAIKVYNGKNYIVTENAEEATLITSDYLSKAKGEGNLIAAFNNNGNPLKLESKDVKVVFEVIEPNDSNRVLRNIAEISKDANANGEEVTDRDSVPNNVDLARYENETIPADNSTWQQDDDDYEPLVLSYFDLSLRKFITGVNETEVTTRVPQVTDLDKLATGEVTTATYTHPKDPVLVKTGDKVTYTIRIYNEGETSGYAEEITDNIPEGLKFLPSDPVNIEYRWQLSEDETKITTDYLSKEVNEDNLIAAFDIDTLTLSYKDVKVVFEVIEPNDSDRILVNIAEISDDADKDGNKIDDRDSTPGNNVPDEDDIDKEYLRLETDREFDLALRKFITKVNSTDVTTRYPKVSLDKDGKIVYKHTKDPVLVANSDIVIYTIRVYNEGEIAGYAKEVTDDIPQGLAYLPKHETNIKYGWVASEDGKTVTTDYLSKEKSDERGEDNLIKAFNEAADITDSNPDYRDLQIAFKVTETNLATNRIIINTAEISDDSDENGNEVEDRDSTPGNNKPDEDDIDKEYLRVKYFDLSLLKWVSKAIVTENGETTVTATGHTGLENPEPVVKVDLDRKNLDNVTVKFEYVIKITNEGEIEGYAKEISDYIPEGLKFVKADNPDWDEKDGKIVTRKLENTLLKPGESATVTVILTWINDENNMGEKVNVAEISEDYNKYNSKDIDSTPNNKKPGEDDIDDAPVMLTIRTGIEPSYTILTLACLSILTTGMILIKKYVL